MNAKIAVFIGAGFAAASLALAGPAEAHSGSGSAGHSTAVGPRTSLSADQTNTSVPGVHEWTSFAAQTSSATNPLNSAMGVGPGIAPTQAQLRLLNTGTSIPVAFPGLSLPPANAPGFAD